MGERDVRGRRRRRLSTQPPAPPRRPAATRPALAPTEQQRWRCRSWPRLSPARRHPGGRAAGRTGRSGARRGRRRRWRRDAAWWGPGPAGAAEAPSSGGRRGLRRRRRGRRDVPTSKPPARTLCNVYRCVWWVVRGRGGRDRRETGKIFMYQRRPRRWLRSGRAPGPPGGRGCGRAGGTALRPGGAGACSRGGEPRGTTGRPVRGRGGVGV